MEELDARSSAQAGGGRRKREVEHAPSAGEPHAGFTPAVVQDFDGAQVQATARRVRDQDIPAAVAATVHFELVGGVFARRGVRGRVKTPGAVERASESVESH
ncbi:MAG: hypothetical protein EBR30_27780 [Cytophagia bacterium]|nr:hypothetical protein [Cytophagia bacterium]NBW38754.1 hypothetical protein [Cytophagia bacterium]